MSQTQQRNFVVIEELYREFGQVAYSLAFRIFGNCQAAEEAVQAVFIDYWHLPEPLESEEFLGWLLQAVRRKCLARRGKIVPLEPLPGNSFPHKVRQVLNSLPADQKDLLELAYFSGQDYRRLAETLRQPAGAVKTRLIRSLVHLKNAAYTR